MDSVFYNSGDSELKNPIGLLIAFNTIACNNYKFSYSLNIKTLRISDRSNI